MKKVFQYSLLALSAAFALSACQQADTAQKPAAPSELGTALDTPVKKASYAFGIDIGYTLQQIKEHGGEEIDIKLLNEAINDVLNKQTLKISDEQAQEVLMVFMSNIQKKAAEKADAEAKNNLAKGEAFLKENATKAGVKTLASGLQYRVKTEGSGKQPKADDIVSVEYEGRLLDGKVFDSSQKHGGAATFSLNQVIAGWREGVQLMKEGSEYTLFIPAHLAYGDRANNDIPPNSTLIFDLKLLKVESAKK